MKKTLSMIKTIRLTLQVLYFCGVSACAQKYNCNMENNEKAKDIGDLRRLANTAKQLQDTTQENFKQASDTEDIRNMLASIPFINDENAARKALSLLQDKHNPVKLRIMAMQRITNIFVNDTAFITTCLNILNDRSDDLAIRNTALNTLRNLRFGSRQLMAMNAEFRNVMRSLLDDPDNNLRSIAAETLALEKDEYVQRRLLEDISKPEQTIMPRAKAIQLLGHDIHAEQFPIVRRILEEKTATESEKIEAIHVLSKDPSSKELLKNLMLDRSQNQEIRLTSASALQAAQPETFIDASKSVILNEKEDKGLRVLCLNGIMQNLDNKNLLNDDEFLQNVTRLGNVSLYPKLKKVSKRYVDSMSLRKGKDKK